MPVERFSVDADRWPGVARVPEGPLLGKRADLARKAFENGSVRRDRTVFLIYFRATTMGW